MGMTTNRWQTAEEHLRKADSIFGPLIELYGPCRLQPTEAFFDNLCESIICQQISTKAAESIMRRFRGLFAAGVAEPEELLRRTDEELRGAGLSPQKIKYVRDLTEKVLQGGLNLSAITGLPNEAIEQLLLNVKGIGPWTVTMFLIFALNRTDVLPTGDLGIRKAMQALYGLNDPPDPAAMRTIAQAWHPYESVGAWYLWRSLESKAADQK